MRTPVLVALLLASAALAVAPSATASGPCMPEDTTCPQPPPTIAPDCRKVPEHPPLVTVSDTCHVTVSIDAFSCPFGEEWITNTYGPVTVRHTVCREPYPPGGDMSAAAAAPPCTCPPPQLLCRPINEAIADNNDGVDWSLSDSCRLTVVVDLTYYATCVYGGSARLTAGPVTVVYPVCTSPCGYSTCQPPMESAAMADPFPTCIRECSPLPSEACALRDATPAPLLHPLWGYDCTLDVHTACTGGASGSLDQRIGFVDVSLAKCSGPSWS